MLPTYNEIENIESMIKTILNLEHTLEMKQLGVENVRVVVVDDNSPDGTGQFVKDFTSQNSSRIHLIEREEKGRGSAGIAGFKYAITQDIDYLIEMDADFSHNPCDIPKLLREIESHDIVIGSRFVSGGQVGPRSILRRLASWIAGSFTRLVLGVNIRDWTSGFKCYKKHTLTLIDYENILSQGYSIGMETLYKLIKLGCSYKEIPIAFEDRNKGKSKFSIREGLDYAKITWRLGYLPK